MSFLSQDLAKNRGSLRIDDRLRPALIEFKMKPVQPSSAKSWQLGAPILFQIVGIRDTTTSCIQYIEQLQELIDVNVAFADRQRHQRHQQHQKIVRSVDVDDSNGHEALDTTASGANGANGSRHLYKLTLQDSFGGLCYAYELEPLQFLSGAGPYPVKLGSKLLVKRGTNVALNCLELTNTGTEFLGGDIDKLNWKLLERELAAVKAEINYGG